MPVSSLDRFWEKLAACAKKLRVVLPKLIFARQFAILKMTVYSKFVEYSAFLPFCTLAEGGNSPWDLLGAPPYGGVTPP